MRTMNQSRFLFTALFVMVAIVASAQSMKMVVDAKDEVVGRYVRTNATTYTIGVQDDVEIPKDGHRVVTYSAENGQGFIYRDQTRKGNINVRKGPSTKTQVVAKIPETDGMPDVYDCLGKENGWYKIRIDGKVGYVRGDLVKWDGMVTF